MKFTNIAILLAMSVALAGCAGANSPAAAQPSSIDPLAQISAFTVADLEAADADAVANKDAIAHACYPALIKFVQSFPNASVSTVSGAFSAFQKGRDLRNMAAGGVPDYLTMGCGPLYAQVHGDILKFLAGAAALP